MRTFWENESVPYALEEETRTLYRLLSDTEERVQSGKAEHILSQAREVTEAQAKSLAALMPPLHKTL